MRQKGLGGELIAELFGTFILILLGDGVVANVGLAPRVAGPVYNWNTIAFGWAFAVVIAVYVVGGVTGAHINPAVTIALAVKRGFPWAKVGPYIIAQVIGAFLGALAVYLVYKDGLVSAGMPNVWATGPGNTFDAAVFGNTSPAPVGTYSLLNCSIAEIIGTMVLLLGVLGAFDEKNVGLRGNVGFLLVGFTVLAIGLSLGGPSGYAINPARDFGPRVFGALAGTQGLFSTPYWLVPIIMPVIGAIIGIFAYDGLVARHLPEKPAA